jgi:nucleoside-diphosphate-sugar epimerase
LTRIAITGARGYLGSFLLENIPNEYRVVTFGTDSRSTYKYNLGGVVVGDNLANVDILVHCAWDFSVCKEEIFRVNVFGALPLLNEAISRNISILHISSLAAHRRSTSKYGLGKLFLDFYLSNYQFGTSLKLGVPDAFGSNNLFYKLVSVSRFLPINLVPGSRKSFVYMTDISELLDFLGQYFQNHRDFQGLYRVSSNSPKLVRDLYPRKKLTLFFPPSLDKVINFFEILTKRNFRSDNLSSLSSQIEKSEFASLISLTG